MDVSLPTWLRRHGVDAPFMALAELTGGAVFVVDAERNVVWWSPAAERILGFSSREMLGAHCLKGVRCAPCMAGCGVAEHGALAAEPLVCHDKAGEAVRIRRSARAFFDADGTFAGAIEVLVPLDAPIVPALTPGVEELHGLVSQDPAMRQAFRTIRNVAETDATVLVRGESGTGKELVAKAIHAESHRRDRPFVAVNCAAFTPTLLESELFGHTRGAFTGATADRAGIFAQADGGTLFLDEVAELPLELQSKLLRVLQERTFTPVGGTRPVKVDVRIVAATHKALREEVKAGRFREDLMYRLRVVPIFLPPLRDRPGDIDLLFDRFVAEYNARGPRRVERVLPEVRAALRAWPWPGNVRELHNVVEYVFAVGRGTELPLECLPREIRGGVVNRAAPATDGSVAMDQGITLGEQTAVRGVDVEQGAGLVATPIPGARPQPVTEPDLGPPDDPATIRAALARTRGNVGEAAALLGISRPTFWRWRKKHGIE